MNQHVGLRFQLLLGKDMAGNLPQFLDPQNIPLHTCTSRDVCMSLDNQ